MKKIYFLLMIVFFQQSFSQSFLNFTTVGTQDQYVPVVFRSTTADGGNRTFFISRPNIHEDRYWLAHGIVAITGIGYGWGSNGNSLRVDNFTFGVDAPSSNGQTISFVGRVVCAFANNDIVVFLRGGTKYYYGNAELISNTGSHQDAAGQNLSTVSITDPLYNLPKGTYYGAGDITAKTSNFAALANGNVGIGVSNPLNTLDVNGLIHAKEVKVDLQNWPDYVFKKEYDLKSLSEVEKFIKENGHLPNIDSATDMVKNGAKLGEMNVKLLEKIEELTLYTIEQNKQLKSQSEKIEILEEKLEKLMIDKK
ncbi:DUF4200 domain-containing protein [Chryseobacterium camelliae]|uniref:DUF4200 domain-containing protein n=1 Tax=Chryseobacterium camelliae TaxID=1265445 RepID=A0ABY7QPQ1_9FLAO|nr:DUF4200 domain-containing protein [Chryseobacterium camelliae]WBV61636.1 DUF4200 domain-containing protein [Chryseobacterium camelliae]